VAVQHPQHDPDRRAIGTGRSPHQIEIDLGWKENSTEVSENKVITQSYN